MANLLDLASLANWVYTNHNGSLLPSDAGAWDPLPLTPDVASLGNDPKYGFYAAAFKNRVTGEIVIAMRGTENRLNLIHDLELGAHFQVPEAIDATKFVEAVAAHNSNATITLTGHSLGGYAAQWAMVKLHDTRILSPNARTALSTVTFNAPGLPAWVLGTNSAVSYNAYNFNTQGDVIHDFGGTQIGQSTSLAAGPSAAQEWTDFQNGLKQGLSFGVIAGYASGAKQVVWNDLINAAYAKVKPSGWRSIRINRRVRSAYRCRVRIAVQCRGLLCK